MVLLDSRPAQAQLADHEYWSATLIAQDGPAIGCNNADSTPAKRCTNSAALTDDDFTYEGTTYSIRRLATFGTTLLLRFTSTTPFLSKSLTLHVDGAQYAFADSTDRGRTQFEWSGSTAWTVGQTVNLRITGPPPLPPPRKPPPPDPNEPEQQPKRCACTQVVASYFPDRCSKCAIIQSCRTT